MSDKNVDSFAFAPYGGGAGVRVTCNSSSSTRGPIPGTEGGTSQRNTRVVVSNGGAVSIFIRLGNQDVTATLDSMEILPRTKEVFTVPFTSPGQLHVAGITESGDASIQVTAGEGS